MFLSNEEVGSIQSYLHFDGLSERIFVGEDIIDRANERAAGEEIQSRVDREAEFKR